jgi:hypothetical protein
MAKTWPPLNDFEVRSLKPSGDTLIKKTDLYDQNVKGIACPSTSYSFFEP